MVEEALDNVPSKKIQSGQFRARVVVYRVVEQVMLD